MADYFSKLRTAAANGAERAASTLRGSPVTTGAETIAPSAAAAPEPTVRGVAASDIPAYQRKYTPEQILRQATTKVGKMGDGAQILTENAVEAAKLRGATPEQLQAIQGKNALNNVKAAKGIDPRIQVDPVRPAPQVMTEADIPRPAAPVSTATGANKVFNTGSFATSGGAAGKALHGVGVAARGLSTAAATGEAGDDLGMVWASPNASTVEKIGASAEALGNVAGGYLMDRVGAGLKGIGKVAPIVGGVGNWMTGLRPVTALSTALTGDSALNMVKRESGLQDDLSAVATPVAAPTAAAAAAAPATGNKPPTDAEVKAALVKAGAGGSADKPITLEQQKALGISPTVTTGGESVGGGSKMVAYDPTQGKHVLVDSIEGEMMRRLNGVGTNLRGQREALGQLIDYRTKQADLNLRTSIAARDSMKFNSELGDKRMKEFQDQHVNNQFYTKEGKDGKTVPDAEKNARFLDFMRQADPRFATSEGVAELWQLPAQQRNRLVADLRKAFVEKEGVEATTNDTQWFTKPGLSNSPVKIQGAPREAVMGDIPKIGLKNYVWSNIPLTNRDVVDTTSGTLLAEDYIGSGEDSKARRAKLYPQKGK